SGFDDTAETGFFAQLSNQKYYDLYSSDRFNGDQVTNVTKCSVATCGGHALFETKSWYGDTVYFVSSARPWFFRGGNYGNTSSAGAWGFYYGNGDVGSSYGFRSVLS
ncbi:MAG: hypothetical protein IJZ79_05990, partial [Bacilli bacterium]|nr:hypothetical protein [Bacilli bacterium]